MNLIATVQRGETARLWLAPRQSGEVLRAALKAAPRRVVPPPTDPEVAVWAVADGVDESGVMGWWLTLSATLAEGLYATDARITLAGGEVQITDPVLISFANAVTGPAA